MGGICSAADHEVCGGAVGGECPVGCSAANGLVCWVLRVDG